MDFSQFIHCTANLLMVAGFLLFFVGLGMLGRTNYPDTAAGDRQAAGNRLGGLAVMALGGLLFLGSFYTDC
jgi:cytochrome c biogenesis protein CcdA